MQAGTNSVEEVGWVLSPVHGLGTGLAPVATPLQVSVTLHSSQPHRDKGVVDWEMVPRSEPPGELNVILRTYEPGEQDRGIKAPFF